MSEIDSAEAHRCETHKFIVMFRQYGENEPGEIPEIWMVVSPHLGGGWFEIKNLETGEVKKDRTTASNCLWYCRTTCEAVQRALIDTRHSLSGRYPKPNLSDEVLERRIIWLTALLAHVWKPVVDAP